MILFNKIKADMARYSSLGKWYTNLGFWVTLVYRFGSWASHLKPFILGLPFRILHRLLVIPVRFFLHVHLPSNAVIGPGLCLPHPYLILVPSQSLIGSDCTLYHDVTLGHGTKPGLPQLNDNVVAFSGSKILGGVEIGKNAHIGVNAVVMRDVESWVIVSAPLSRSIPIQMSKKILDSHKKS